MKDAKLILHIVGILTVLPFSIGQGCCNNTSIKKTDLLECLLDKSDKVSNIRPQYDQGTPLTIAVQLSMYDIGYEDPTSMTYESALYIKLSWNDQRMSYSSCETNDSFTISGPDVDKCWTPDLYFHEGRKAGYYEVLRKNEDMYLHKQGDVVFSSRITLKFHCQFDFSKYPFDRQICKMKLRSYGFHANDLILEWSSTTPVSIKESPGFSIIGLARSFEPTYIDSSANYSVLTATLMYKRSAISYTIMYVGPQIVSVIITFLSFLLLNKENIHEHITARLSICTGGLTSMFLVWAGIYAKLPPVSNLSMLDIWLLSNVCFIGGSAVIHLITYKLGSVKCYYILVACIFVAYVIFVPVFVACLWRKDVVYV